MANEPTVTREMAEAAWRHLWSQKRWAIEDVQEAIRAALAVQSRTHVVVERAMLGALVSGADVNAWSNARIEGERLLAASTEKPKT